ncbi:alginate lyase family protein [Novosphingobium sp. EMRT-2]|uniref:alginate lyase family protein n=1 Tax=Novosphingobium sp. EMRT-2 TaxID=2571749 RepID=UPI00086E2DFC|nr:alginate lyase family protein [Novosphingobium sp. EMRT-2]ODU68643.1 MAG: hypothetical protein ABT11_15895 [Novosphingobium sp. SCN 66-18]QCI93113.1 hypothetical protein FA702_05795 [Novosphingobium sp. EMRT-2]
MPVPAVPLLLLAGAAGVSPGCPPVATIPRTMEIVTRYVADDSDATRSRLDPGKVQAQAGVRAAIVGPVRRINALADRYRQAPDPAAARCLAAHFAAQAQAGAMTVSPADADMFFREWMIASLAISYLKAKSALDAMPEGGMIRSWLVQSARAVQAFNQQRIDRGLIDNHRYWGGLAALATGLAANDRGLVAFGRNSRALGLAQVTPEGTLAAELKRGPKSLHYHLFAAAPLAASAELDPSGLSAAERGALTRLADRILDDAGTPSGGRIGALAGQPQEAPEAPILFALLRPYAGQTGGYRQKLDALLAGARPTYLFLGGDTTFLTR